MSNEQYPTNHPTVERVGWYSSLFIVHCSLFIIKLVYVIVFVGYIRKRTNACDYIHYIVCFFEGFPLGDKP